MNKQEINFLSSIQDFLDNEIIYAQEKNPMCKYQLERLYQRVNGFLNLLKKEIEND